MPAQRSPTRALSTIELTLLGLAWLRGPCTIYSLMKELSASASSFHKSRAGTAYSVSNRLLGFGLLERCGPGPEGEVRVTDQGIEAIQAWLKPPIPYGDISHSADLIRLRFFFIGIIDKADRLAFIDSSIAGLREFLQRCTDLISANQAIGDYFGALATASTILETRARIRWLQIVRRWVENPIQEPDSWAETILEYMDCEGTEHPPAS